MPYPPFLWLSLVAWCCLVAFASSARSCRGDAFDPSSYCGKSATASPETPNSEPQPQPAAWKPFRRQPSLSRFAPKSDSELSALILELAQDCKPLPVSLAADLIYRTTSLFSAEDTLVHLQVPPAATLAIVGDLHGDLPALEHILALNGLPSPAKRYLFNGDFVDKGPRGLQVIMTLLAYKLANPGDVHLTRGNHEDIGMNRQGGFCTELFVAFGQAEGEAMEQLFQKLWSSLPLAYVVQEKIFVVHGGLPHPDTLLADIVALDRHNADLNEVNPVTDMLWSDPTTSCQGRTFNIQRQMGHLFGPLATEAFLAKNSLSEIVRSHQPVSGGFNQVHGARVSTVYSIPTKLAAFLVVSPSESDPRAYRTQVVQFDKNGNVPPVKRGSFSKLRELARKGKAALSTSPPTQ